MFITFSDSMTFIIPSNMILFLIGHFDLKSKILFREIISAVTALVGCSPQQEEFLMILHRCKFPTESYRAMDISFDTFCQVINSDLRFYAGLIQIFSYFQTTSQVFGFLIIILQFAVHELKMKKFLN